MYLRKIYATLYSLRCLRSAANPCIRIILGEKYNERKQDPPAAALLPIAVFLVLYLGLGIVLGICAEGEDGLLSIPIVVAFLVAILVACLQNRSISFDEKLALMGQGVGDKNIVTMILIFLAAGHIRGCHRAAAAPRLWPTSCCPSPRPSWRWRCCSWWPALCPPPWAPAWAPSP